MAQQAETTTPPNGTSNPKQKSTHMTQRAENPITPVEPVHARTGAKTNTPETVVARPGRHSPSRSAEATPNAARGPGTRQRRYRNGTGSAGPDGGRARATDRPEHCRWRPWRGGVRHLPPRRRNFPRSDGADLPIGTLAVHPNFRAGFCNFRNGGYEEEMRGIDEVQVGARTAAATTPRG
jgi:hypothetical protein